MVGRRAALVAKGLAVLPRRGTALASTTFATRGLHSPTPVRPYYTPLRFLLTYFAELDWEVKSVKVYT